MRTSNALIAALTVAVLAIGSQAGATPQRGHEKATARQAEQRRPRGEQPARPAPVQVQPQNGQRDARAAQAQRAPAPVAPPPQVRPAPNARPQTDTRGASPQSRVVPRTVTREAPRYDDRNASRNDARQAPRYDDRQAPRYDDRQVSRYDGRQAPRYDGRQVPRYDDRGSNRPPVYIVPQRTVRVYRPYYSFRPRFSLSFGLFVGYPVAYPTWYDPFGFDGYYFGTRYSSYRSSYGGVAFDIQPLDTAIYVDDEYVGRAEDFSPFSAPLTLFAGTHRIELDAQGCRPLSFDLTVVPRQVIPYRGTLRCY